MPIEDANKELANIINPAGIIAGMKESLNPAIQFLLENIEKWDKTTQALMIDSFNLIQRWDMYFAAQPELDKNNYLRKYNAEHQLSDVPLGEVPTTNDQPPT